MRNIMLDVRLKFDGGKQRWASEEILLWFLGVLSRLNLYYLKQNPSTPKLYDSKVKYSEPEQMKPRVPREKLAECAAYLRSIGADDETVATVLRFLSGIEVFRDIPTLYKRGSGDCDNLVVARVAELWLAGVSASPCMTSRAGENGGTIYHALVLHPDGSSEDPSLILGMGGEGRAADRAEEIRKNHERRDTLIAAAHLLMDVGQGTAESLGALVDGYGYVPKGGFR